MGYIFCLVIGFLFAILLCNYDEMKRNLKQKLEFKRYNKLLLNQPKHGIIISKWGEFWRYRSNPFILDGEVCTVEHRKFWHVNDEYVRIITKTGDFKGYLERNIMNSRRLESGGYEHLWGLTLSDDINSSSYRKPVTLCMILNVV